MRVAIIASALVGGLAAGPAFAADATPMPDPVPVPTPVGLHGGFLSEARFGVFSVDPFSENGSETAALHAELLFQKPFTPADLFTSYFVPRPHLGASLDLDGGVSFAFAGLTWTFDLGERVFVEASIGGALQETRAAAYTSAGLADGVAAGCGPSLRESASLGYRFSDTWSVVASVEHLSNDGLCDEPTSMTNFGARLGYSF
ncbi:acyloxyacyl hydrolase [Salinarimonas ramus]|uniref:Acyloxyacyl hydrolase n=1 Tax=Salinarimonas ramus TaxID=690164 RepID=A0A917Q3W1_9HYPH|nr:acyloxyacyl hydrolase [Salinarimonas ramus]GGK17789.1 acyloxyacyl hydrolase [Salinarimonas ramus]